MVVDGSRLAHATHTVRRVDWIARLCTVWLITDSAVAHAEKKRRRGGVEKGERGVYFTKDSIG